MDTSNQQHDHFWHGVGDVNVVDSCPRTNYCASQQNRFVVQVALLIHDMMMTLKATTPIASNGMTHRWLNCCLVIQQMLSEIANCVGHDDGCGVHNV